MRGEPAPSDYDMIKYFVEQGYGLDIAFIVQETGIPRSRVVALLKGMQAKVA